LGPIWVWETALEHFNWKNTHSVDYSGYLINHTKGQAIDLADYRRQSVFMLSDGDVVAIDPVPVLTETGGGTQMALFDGVSVDSTEELAETWCGDLLQIVDELPDGIGVVNCCFAPARGRAKYCYTTFGTGGNGIVLKDDEGNWFRYATFYISGARRLTAYIKAEMVDGELQMTTYPPAL
jgi:hypothetical protein